MLTIEFKLFYFLFIFEKQISTILSVKVELSCLMLSLTEFRLIRDSSDSIMSKLSNYRFILDSSKL
jgi:hypothetical protein